MLIFAEKLVMTGVCVSNTNTFIQQSKMQLFNKRRQAYIAYAITYEHTKNYSYKSKYVHEGRQKVGKQEKNQTGSITSTTK